MPNTLFRTALVLSFLLHVGTFLILNYWPEKEEEKEEVIEIAFIQAPDDKKIDEKSLQIVEQNDKALNDEIPEKADYLGKHNQRVVKETRAKENGQFKNTAGGVPSEAGQNQVKKEEKKPKKKALAKSHRGGLPTLAALTPKFDWQKLAPKRGLNPNQLGNSQTNDYLSKDKDIGEGLQTLLNTREFVYHTYYTRIRRQLQHNWEAKIKEKMTKILRQGREIASMEEDRITQLIIVLNNQGLLKKVQVIGESGVQDLDEAAIEAFEEAAPFPNPPDGMIEKDGTVKIRWDFVLEA